MRNTFSLPGYDAWKTNEATPGEREPCPDCGGLLRRARGTQGCWFCERCDDIDIRLEDKRQCEAERFFAPDDDEPF
jgi:hypothetical protein